MRHRVAVTLLRASAAAALILAVLVGGAFAAEAPSSRPSGDAGVAQGTVDVQFWMEDQTPQAAAVAIVSTALDPSVPLPAVVQIPVPDGMTVDWAGEISSSGDINADIQREFELKEGKGGSYVEFQLTTFRVGQIDLGAVPVTVSGDEVNAEFRYVQSVPASETAFSVKVPPLASEVEIAPKPVGAPRASSVGETLYTLPSASMRPGQAKKVTVSYVLRAGNVAGAQTSDPLDRLIWVLAGGAAAVAVALIWMLTRRRPAPRAESQSTDAVERTEVPYADDETTEPRDEGAEDPFEFDE